MNPSYPESKTRHTVPGSLRSSTLLLFLLLMIMTTTAQQTNQAEAGSELFERRCIKCHGKDGTKGFLGAKDLRTSRKTDEELITIITKGKKIMPSWEKRLTREQMILVVEYIKTLRR